MSINIGDTFGSLTVAAAVPADTHGHKQWRCRCACGGSAVRTTSSLLRAGATKVCAKGCPLAPIRALKLTHGLRRDPLYSVWSNMRARCNNPRNPSYKDYGARGITVCGRWDSFATFRADVGPRPRNTTLERRDNSAGYSPDNCVWASRIAQGSNKRNNVRLPSGETVAEASRRTGTPASTLYSAVRRSQ